jgi:6-phosphogluconolactonase
MPTRIEALQQGVTLRWCAVRDSSTLQATAATRVLIAARDAIAARGRFSLVLSGGHTPRGVYRLLRAAEADWARWHIFLGDERCAPPQDAQRNSAMAIDSWLAHVPVPTAQQHWIAAELGPHVGAARYAETLRGVGRFDLVLLGLGEDGHVASLFAGADWGTAPASPPALPVLDAPKPPPQRVTLSAARLNDTRGVLFLIDDDSKRAALERWRAGDLLPATAIRPVGGVDVLLTDALLDAALGI